MTTEELADLAIRQRDALLEVTSKLALVAIRSSHDWQTSRAQELQQLARAICGAKSAEELEVLIRDQKQEGKVGQSPAASESSGTTGGGGKIVPVPAEPDPHDLEFVGQPIDDPCEGCDHRRCH